MKNRPASRGDVCRHTLAQDVFFHQDPVQFDVRIIGLEFGRECFEFDHRRVINRSDGHSFLLGQNMGSSK